MPVFRTGLLVWLVTLCQASARPPTRALTHRFVVVLYAASLLLGAPPAHNPGDPALGLVVLPIVLSVDNFMAAALETSGGNYYREATTMAVASFLMAMVGCVFGGAVSFQWPRFVRPLVRQRVTRRRRRDDPVLICVNREERSCPSKFSPTVSITIVPA